jgi:type IV pilus assembly protein PilZ
MGEELASPGRDPRFDVDIEVNCRTSDLFLANHVTNISKGGLFIRSDHPLPINSEVHLRFRLPETGVTIETSGRVVWNYDIARGTAHVIPGSGIKFVGLSRGDREAIEKYLERLAGTRRWPRAAAASA